MTRKISAIVIIMLLAACAGPSPFTSELGRADSEDFILLKQSTGYAEKRGIMGLEWTEWMVRGKYRAIYENTEGVFYEGPVNCIVQRIEGNNVPNIYNGGIWWPKPDSEQVPRLFYYVEKTAEEEAVMTDSAKDKPGSNIALLPPINDRVFLDIIRHSMY